MFKEWVHRALQPTPKGRALKQRAPLLELLQAIGAEILRR